MAESVPVITIDGPSGTGKGTLAHLLAAELNWHILDSGALYRLVGLAASRHHIEPEDSDKLYSLALNLAVEFSLENPDSVLLEGKEVGHELRLETTGEMASRVAAVPAVRDALMARQKAFRRSPGLVADGRDMGTVVFPDAQLKIFLTASAEERAQRRYKQLINKGVCGSLPSLLRDIESRDERDAGRSVSPLVPAEDAVVIDTTDLDADQVLEKVLLQVRTRFPQRSTDREKSSR